MTGWGARRRSTPRVDGLFQYAGSQRTVSW
jgi:hypothetical protein